MTRALDGDALAVVKRKIARAVEVERDLYARLVADACEAVDRVASRKRIARGTISPESAFTRADLAWFARPL